MNLVRETIIAVDFDGTLAKTDFPTILKANEPLIRHLINQRRLGNKVILWTCRCGKYLDEAVAWCKEQGLVFDAVNENLPEPIEWFGGDSRKIFADYYIDDKNVTVYVPKDWEE